MTNSTMRIIANPRAGHGTGARSIQALRDAIRRRDLDATIVLTERPGHATTIARELAGSEPRLAVLGGDGTIGEVADAIAGTDTELAILPMGTGNDVARSLGIPLDDLDGALDVAFGGRVRAIDVGRERERHFVSVLGLGFPAIVAEQANRTRLRGSSAFFVAVYRAMSRLRPARMTIRLDDRTLEGECVAVMVQNTPFTGGASAIGLVASMTVFPARFDSPAARSASAATVPLTARTTRSANCAASAKPPTRPLGFCDAQSASLAGSRVPIITSWPCFRKPPPKTFATSPDPSTPTFMNISFSCILGTRGDCKNLLESNQTNV